MRGTLKKWGYAIYWRGVWPHKEEQERGGNLEYLQADAKMPCSFYDRTSGNLRYFDELKKDEGYAAIIESSPVDLILSNHVKRFFRSFTWLSGKLFRKVLQRMFILQLSSRFAELKETRPLNEWVLSVITPAQS